MSEPLFEPSGKALHRRMTDCNRFRGVASPLRRSDTRKAPRRCGIIARKVVSRGEGISQMPCSTWAGAKSPIVKFSGDPQPEAAMGWVCKRHLNQKSCTCDAAEFVAPLRKWVALTWSGQRLHFDASDELALDRATHLASGERVVNVVRADSRLAQL